MALCGRVQAWSWTWASSATCLGRLRRCVPKLGTGRSEHSHAMVEAAAFAERSPARSTVLATAPAD